MKSPEEITREIMWSIWQENTSAFKGVKLATMQSLFSKRITKAIQAERFELAFWQKSSKEWREGYLRLEKKIDELRKDNESLKKTYTKELISELEKLEIVKLRSALREAVESLELILPLAKGYAHEHKVGSNNDYVVSVEDTLAKLKGILGE